MIVNVRGGRRKAEDTEKDDHRGTEDTGFHRGRFRYGKSINLNTKCTKGHKKEGDRWRVLEMNNGQKEIPNP